MALGHDILVTWAARLTFYSFHGACPSYEQQNHLPRVSHRKGMIKVTSVTKILS